MGKLVHTSRNTITRVEGQVRKAFIEGFEEPVFYAVHGGIKQFYKLEPEEEHATTFDHIIALRFPRGRKMNPARHSSTIFLTTPVPKVSSAASILSTMWRSKRKRTDDDFHRRQSRFWESPFHKGSILFLFSPLYQIMVEKV